MTEIDVWCAYTRVPGFATQAFPDPISVPLMDVIIFGSKGEGIGASALLDTGAAFNLFSVEYAEALDIDWKAAPSFIFSAVGVPEVTGHVVDVQMALKDEQCLWPCKVVFSEAAFPFPILGHMGFFDHFEVRFDTAKRGFRLIGGRASPG